MENHRITHRIDLWKTFVEIRIIPLRSRILHMLYIICMVAGLLLSRALRLERIARPIGWAQTAVTLILIACMGYRLGSRPDFIHELSSMGLMSLLYCIVPSVFSIALVYVVTRFLLKEKKNGRNRDSW